jgi:fermentation-respiration switch protein FrsA (DUF1100 family)
MGALDAIKKKLSRHCWGWLLIPALGGGVLLSVLACTHPVRRLIFQPHHIQHIPVFPHHQPGLERFWLQTDAGGVEGWLIRGHGVSRQHPGPAVMMAHGNSELIDHYLYRALRYRRMGITVLLGEYRGYGRSQGHPSREGIRADYIRYYEKLASVPEVDPERIFFHGRSLGGAVLAELVPHRRPAAVILESTFTSVKAMASGIPDFLLSDRYDTLSAMVDYGGPVLIIHGSRDQVVPVTHAQRLKRAIPHAAVFIDDFGHNDPPDTERRFWRSIENFLREHHLFNTDMEN